MMMWGIFDKSGLHYGIVTDYAHNSILNNQYNPGAGSLQYAQSVNITEELEEISEQQQAELDAMTMSNTVPPHYLINGTGNSQLDGFLQDRNCPYYHEQHWGKEVYMYSPTRGDFKDTSTIVVYDGARGARGKRYLVKLDNTGDMQIKKSHWKSKWRNKIWQADLNAIVDPEVEG